MTKTGRNDPCPCGSGKKYKHCCLKKDEAAEHEALAAAAAAKPPRPIAPKTMVYPDFDDEEDDLASASNAVVDLVCEWPRYSMDLFSRKLTKRCGLTADGVSGFRFPSSL